MTVPLAVKELRPLRGAFGVLDREPLARHRQMEGQARSLPQTDAAQPIRAGVQTRKIQARFRATYVPQVTWAAPVGGGERPRLQRSELRIRSQGRASWLSSKQPRSE